MLLKIGTAALAMSAFLAAGLLGSGTQEAEARPPVDDYSAVPGGNGNGNGPKGDNFKNPMAEKQDQLKQKALQKVLKGQARPRGTNAVVEAGKGQFVELANEGTDPVFVIIAEFGNARHSAFCDFGQTCAFPGDGTATTYEGPLHNEIPEPDRSVDNSSLWQEDYDGAHYDDMYFNRMAEYYETQSSGRYSIVGDVNGWVRVPFNEARYGRDFCGGIVCNNTWFLIRDAMAYWVQGQLTAGQTSAQIASYLSTFDVQDRYDYDADGVFDEKDGYIDHFQIVHAGGDQAAGDPIYGTDAIWSHRWYAQVVTFGTGGPTVNGTVVPFGGLNAGQGGPSGGLAGGIPNNPVGVWVGDYTIQPENGGLGVFAHEYGHDLGLPDLYDTSGNTGGAENSTGFWTLMSSGANIGDGGPNGIGDHPTDLGAWEKFQLGWLGFPGAPGGTFYQVAFAGLKSTHKLGWSEFANKQAQALFVVLPDKAKDIVLVDPPQGDWVFYSTSGDDLNTSMTKTTGIVPGALTATVWHEIEEDWDYAFIEARVGTTWTELVTNLSDNADDQSGFNPNGTGITGFRGLTALTATLTAGTNALRVRYQTDGAVAELGFVIDDIKIGGVSVGNAETDTEGWVFDGFVRTTGSETSFHFNAYVVENRGYRSYDTSLATAYNFGFLNTMPDWVEHFRYQDGMLISYWDTSFGDNGVGDHPGGGLILPIDAHPTFHHYCDGQLVRPRVLSFDSTFTLARTDAITINKNGCATNIASQPAVSKFNDMLDYWFPVDEHPVPLDHVGRYEPEWVGVNVPKTGTTIRLVDVDDKGFLTIHVNK